MIKVLNIAVALSTLLISNFSTIAKTENNQVKQDELSINFEGAYSNLGESFDSKLVTSVSDKSLIKVILDEPIEIEQLNYERPCEEDSIEEVQQSLSDYRKEVQDIIYSNNLETAEKLNESLDLGITWNVSEIGNLLTAEINSYEITNEFIAELEQIYYSIENIDSIYVSESSPDYSCDYSMNDVYNYTNLTDAVNSSTYIGRGINFGIIDGGVLNLSKYRGNSSTNNDYTGRNIYIRNRNTSYNDHSDHVAMLSVGNNGIARGTNIYSTTFNDSFESNMKWMIENNVNIVNTSYGSYSSTNNGAYTSDAKLADQFVRDYFISLVGSAGNLRSDLNPNNEISSPKTAYNYITIGNTSSSKEFVSSTSSYAEKNSYGGSKPNIVAPGYTKTNSYNGKYVDGTSFATPITAGALSLLMEEFPYLTAFPELCISILTSSASPLSSSYNNSNGDNYFHSSGLHNKFGSGMLNYEKMREAASNYLSVSRKKGKTSGILDQTLDFNVAAGKRIRASLAWLATGGNNSFTDYDLRLYKLNPNGSESLVKSIYGADNNVEFLDYKVKTGGQFRLAIYQNDTNQQTDYIGLSYTTIDNIIGGSESGGIESTIDVPIAPTDYGFADAYPTDDYTRTNFITHTLPSGFTFETRRYRTGYIHDEYVVMSPFRSGITEAFIEYKFNVLITKIEVDLSHWRSLSNEWTYSSNCIAEIRTSSGFKVDLLSSTMNLPTDRTNPYTYTIVFDKPVYSFGFYMESKRINTNDSNRGRLCIGNMKVHTAESWY